MVAFGEQDAQVHSKSFARPRSSLGRAGRFLATWGPGLLVMVADTDPGNVVTAAQGGAAYGYRLLPLTLLLAIPLFFVQELTVRLGIFSGRGFGQMVREEFGVGWAWLAAATLFVAALGSLVTEFTGVAGIGEIYGIARPVSLAAAAVLVIAIAMSGSYRRIERIALLIGAFELAFFVVAWQAGPDGHRALRESVEMPLRDANFGFLAAALIGASFNPWMVFYQQSAVVERRITPEQYGSARWDTAAGALLTQCLSAAVLVAAAATLGRKDPGLVLTSVGQISDAFTAVSPHVSRLVFSMGVLGAALVAVIVSSLAVSWGIGEVLGFDHCGGRRALDPRWFQSGYALAVVGSALAVGLTHNLIWLNIAVQVANAMLLPVVLGLLITLATRQVVGERRLRGRELALVVVFAGGAALAGLAGIASFVSG